MGQVVQEECIIKGRDGAQGGHYKMVVQKECIIKGRDGAQGGHYKRERWCTRRTL